MIGSYYLGIINTPKGKYNGLFAMVFIYFASFIPIYIAKKNSGGNGIEFKEAIKFGLRASLICSFVFALSAVIYYYFINPDFASPYLLEAKKYYEGMGKTAEEVALEIKALGLSLNSFREVTKVLFFSTFFGFMFSAVNALVFCKKN